MHLACALAGLMLDRPGDDGVACRGRDLVSAGGGVAELTHAPLMHWHGGPRIKERRRSVTDDATRQRRLRNVVEQSRQPRLDNPLMPLSSSRHFSRFPIDIFLE
jgi:hypothetical protein